MHFSLQRLFFVKRFLLEGLFRVSFIKYLISKGLQSLLEYAAWQASKKDIISARGAVREEPLFHVILQDRESVSKPRVSLASLSDKSDISTYTF